MKKIALVLMALLPSLVMAHEGHEHASSVYGMVNGALHPLLGLDHLFALLAVGLFASRLPKQQALMASAGFIAMMAIGFYGAHAGWHSVVSGATEIMIAISVLWAASFAVMGWVMKKQQALNSVALWSMVVFAVFHGIAHGVEIPVEASLHGFGLGFLTMSSILILSATTAFGFAKSRVNTLKTAKIKVDH